MTQHPGLTEAEFTILSNYIRQTADALGLKDWALILSQEPCEVEHRAEVVGIFGRRWAEIKVCPDFRQQLPDLQRQAVAHELIHCHMDVAGHWAMREHGHLVPKSQEDVFDRTYVWLAEFGIDGIASAIAPMLPLIPWEESLGESAG